MFLERVCCLDRIAASAAIIASLLFVGLQMRQADKNGHAASLRSVLDG